MSEQSDAPKPPAVGQPGSQSEASAQVAAGERTEPSSTLHLTMPAKSDNPDFDDEGILVNPELKARAAKVRETILHPNPTGKMISNIDGSTVDEERKAYGQPPITTPDAPLSMTEQEVQKAREGLQQATLATPGAELAGGQSNPGQRSFGSTGPTDAQVKESDNEGAQGSAPDSTTSTTGAPPLPPLSPSRTGGAPPLPPINTPGGESTSGSGTTGSPSGKAGGSPGKL